ncbi:MAG: tRNA 2-thiouridine(34) synthase MnmA [Pseudomonadota bacterium]
MSDLPSDLPSLPPLSPLVAGKPPAQTLVAVAMSGGVDSAVVAAWLARLGYRVIGLTLQLYDHGAMIGKSKACCAGADIADARSVAARAGFPHYVLDYQARFERDVIDDFAASYAAGQTPIPCVRCNQKVKFRDLLATAQDLGADCLATGHYVRRKHGAAGPELHKAQDTGRDQSYFLFTTTPEQLAYLRFPLGNLHKSETRALARALGLALADKPDSQDICFVPQGSYTKVVGERQPRALKPGDIYHIDGRALGRHPGIAHFTIGQRRGLALERESEPLYVVNVDAASRRVIVGPRTALARDHIDVREVTWLTSPSSPPSPPLPPKTPVQIKIRAAGPPLDGLVTARGEGQAHIELNTPAMGVAPGQGAVFYDGSRVLGGGWIAASASTKDTAPAPGRNGLGWSSLGAQPKYQTT